MSEDIKPVAINLAMVKKNAIEWYKAGKLTAQHPEKNKRLCVNNGADGYRCAVAASYPEDFKEEGSIYALRDHNLVFFPKEDEKAIYEIQRAHDTWAQPSDYCYCDDELQYGIIRLRKEIEFLKTIL